MKKLDAPNCGAALLSLLSQSALMRLWKSLSELDQEDLLSDWKVWGRTHQRAPDGDWRRWVFMGGRGAGKTRAGAEWVSELARYGRAGRIALIGPTFHDVG